jgi:hypothetical protein
MIKLLVRLDHMYVMSAKTSSLLNIQELLDQMVIMVDIHRPKELFVVQDSLEAPMLLVLPSRVMRLPMIKEAF